MNEPSSVLIFTIVCLLTSLWQQSSHTAEERNTSPCLSKGPSEYGRSNFYRVFVTSGFQAILSNWLLQWAQTMNESKQKILWSIEKWVFFTCSSSVMAIIICDTFLIALNEVIWCESSSEWRYILQQKTVTFKHNLDAVGSLGRPWQSCCHHGNTEFSFRSVRSETNFILGKWSR